MMRVITVHQEIPFSIVHDYLVFTDQKYCSYEEEIKNGFVTIRLPEWYALWRPFI